MAGKFRQLISRNLAQPGRGVVGFILKGFFKRNNYNLEQNAARLCGIQPDNQVLEVGFGPGIGLKAAYQYVKGGKGKVYGVDLSEAMVKEATRLLKQEIQAGKVEITVGNVMQLPFHDEKFHHVFHCNCYYFWPDVQEGASELLRVMRPESCMVTLFHPEVVRKFVFKGYLTQEQTDPENYMKQLSKAGFHDVKMESVKLNNGEIFNVISADKK